MPFISINLDILQNPLEQCLFRLSYVFFKNKIITFFASFFFYASNYQLMLLKIKIAVIFAVSITSAHSN